MLKLVTGRAGTGKTAFCLNEITKRAAKDPTGDALILLTPEHMTFSAERELARILGCCTRVKAAGFRRFARNALLAAGGAAVPRVSEIGREIILQKILRDNKSKFTAFTHAAHGFAALLSETVKELKSWRFSADEAEKAAQNTDNETLRGKLMDLSLIEREFDAAMAGRFTDDESLMEELCRRLPKTDFMKNAEVYIDGFVFFNPQELAVIRTMLPLAQNITVTLTMDAAENSLENTEETGLFNRAEQTRRTLVTLAQELDIPVKTLPFGESKRFKSKDLMCIEKDLFRLKYEKSETDGGVTIIETANKRLETAAAASEIIRLTATGARYKDIGIITRDETYFAPLKQALFDAGIPFFADDKRRGAAHPLAELIKGVFAALRRWRHEDILRVLRTGFLPAVTEQIDILENYAREFGINGKRHWLAEESWRWLRTEEYSVLKAVNDEKKENTDTDLIERAANIERKLTTIDLLRRTATAPLANFADKLQKSKTLREITLALYEFLMELDVPVPGEDGVRLYKSRV